MIAQERKRKVAGATSLSRHKRLVSRMQVEELILERGRDSLSKVKRGKTGTQNTWTQMCVATYM